MSTIRDFDQTQGQEFQGDIAFVPVPDDIVIDTTDAVAPIDGRLIIQEGEASGHHHAIDLLDRGTTRRRKTSRAAERLMAAALAREIALPTARMFRDQEAVAEMCRRGILLRPDLAIGILVVEHGPMVVSHEEHDGIRLQPGRFYVGRQVESAGAEERVVVD